MRQRFEAALSGYILERQVGELQMLFRHLHPVIPEVSGRSHAELPLEKLRQRGMVERRRLFYAFQRNALLIIALDIDDRVLEVGVLDPANGGIRPLLPEEAVCPLEQKDHLHKIRPAAAGPVPVPLLAQLVIEAPEEPPHAVAVLFEKRENVSLAVGEGAQQKQVVAHRQVLILFAVDELEGHIDVEERRVEIDRVAFQPAFFRQPRLLALVEADEARGGRLEGLPADAEPRRPLAQDEQEEAVILYIEVLERIVRHALNGREPSDVVSAPYGLRYHNGLPFPFGVCVSGACGIIIIEGRIIFKRLRRKT